MMWRRLSIVTAVVAGCAVAACDRGTAAPATVPAGGTTRPAVDTSRLNARMTDDEIIGAFGLEASSVKRELVRGKDGTSTTFTSGGQKVTVTRSLVSGVTVVASGPKSGVWTVGKP